MPVDIIAVRPLPEDCLELDDANKERRRFDMRPCRP